MRRKMIPPMPEIYGESGHKHFKRFAKALLSVPRSEVMPAEEDSAKFQAEKQKVDAKIAEVRQVLAKRRHSAKRKEGE